MGLTLKAITERTRTARVSVTFEEGGEERSAPLDVIYRPYSVALEQRADRAAEREQTAGYFERLLLSVTCVRDAETKEAVLTLALDEHGEPTAESRASLASLPYELLVAIHMAILESISVKKTT
jgi:hypothetical protein